MALVFSPGSFDALVWVGRDRRVEPLEQLNDGLDAFTPTGLTLQDQRLSALVEGRDDG